MAALVQGDQPPARQMRGKPAPDVHVGVEPVQQEQDRAIDALRLVPLGKAEPDAVTFDPALPLGGARRKDGAQPAVTGSACASSWPSLRPASAVAGLARRLTARQLIDATANITMGTTRVGRMASMKP